MIGELEVSVVDLSIKGARLQVTEPVPLGAVVPLIIWADERTVTTKATVLWCQLVALSMNDEEMDRYLCGVMFEKVVPEISDVIEELMGSGDALPIEDARNVERYRITAPLTANFGANAGNRMARCSFAAMAAIASGAFAARYGADATAKNGV